MAKDSRIVIRLDAAIDEWLGEQAALRGMDKAAFARMILYERRNGMAASVVVAAAQPARPAAPARAAVAVATRPIVPQDEQAEVEDEAAQEAVDPAVFDDLLAQRLAEAEQQGLAAAPAIAIDPDEDAEAYQDLGVRPFRRGAPPSYGTMSRPIVRERV